MSFVGLLLYGCKWNLHLTINAQTVVGGVVARRVFWSRKILESCHSGCVWCHILTFDQVGGSTTNTSSLNRSCINKEVPAKFALSRRIYFFFIFQLLSSKTATESLAPQYFYIFVDVSESCLKRSWSKGSTLELLLLMGFAAGSL